MRGLLKTPINYTVSRLQWFENAHYDIDCEQRAALEDVMIGIHVCVFSS